MTVSLLSEKAGFVRSDIHFGRETDARIFYFGQVRRRENALFSMDRSALRPVERGTHEMVLATRTG